MQKLITTAIELLLQIAAAIAVLRLQQGKIMATLDDLNAAVAAIQTAVNNAVTLIQSLHTGVGTVSDAEVEAAVTELKAAATALGGAQAQP